MLFSTSLKKKSCFPICINMLYHSKRKQNLSLDLSSPLLLLPAFSYSLHSLPAPWGEGKVRDYTFCYHFLILLTFVFSHQVRVYISSSDVLYMFKCPYLPWPPWISDSAFSCFQKYLYQQILQFLRVRTIIHVNVTTTQHCSSVFPTRSTHQIL